MAQVYALLVGINEYPPPIPSLRGCVNDIEDAHQYLLETVGSRVHVRKLLNQEATCVAVIDGFRRHLGRAGPGDTALFWFSGHGSTLDVPPGWWHLEPNGTTMQTLVCVDSRGTGKPHDLLDKHLAVLIRGVASRGAHVVVVLDCCHSGGATRTLPPSAGVRQIEPATVVPDAAHLTSVSIPDREDHVALVACQSYQLAHELPDVEGRHRGVFSRGVLAELRRPGAARTYRDLVASTRGFVENLIERQTPGLYPPGAAIVDQPFLGGHARPPVTTMTMRDLHGEWFVDAGSAHGFGAGAGDYVSGVAVCGSEPVLEARVVRVHADRSLVEPVGWEPEPGRVFPVVLSDVAIPETTVSLGGRVDDDESVAREIEASILTAGPGGGASPHLRVIPWNGEASSAELFVATPPEGEITIRSADGTVLAAASTDRAERGRRKIVDTLEHIARWRRIRTLRNPTSRLVDLVRVQILLPEPREYRTPRDRPGLRTGATGAIELEYQYGKDGFTPPSVFIRLDNTSDRPLHCVLLDLTDRFRIHANLFPGDFIDPGASAAAAEGDLIEISLPDTRAVRPGARVQDWLMLIVSEDKINSDHFAVPRLGEPPVDRDYRAPGLVGIVERLALSAQFRDADRKPAAACDWWTSVTEIVTRVPGDSEPGR